MFSKNAFLIFRKRRLLIFSINAFFLNFGKDIFKKPGMFRTRSIFKNHIHRALVYLETKASSEQCQTSTVERLAKIATWHTF